MKKLTFSLMLAVLVAIIGLGWGLDNIFSQSQEQSLAQSDELSAYRLLGSVLAKTIDEQANTDQFIANWQQYNEFFLESLDLSEFPLPDTLESDFQKGKPLVLESDDGLSMYFIMPKHQKVLTLGIPPNVKTNDFTSLQLILTSLFYIGILVTVLIWLYPLIKRLKYLSLAAKSFGEGKLEQRINTSPISYIADIETEFNRMAQRIETLISDNKLLGNAVSHDLRTPLARLRFGIEVLQETKDPDTRKKHERHISQDIAEMERLVEVLLNYARFEQSIIEVEQSPIDLNEIISQCIHSLESSHLKINWKPGSRAVISGNSNYLIMLVNNLLQNAIQHAKSNIKVDIKQNKANAILTIADDGIGIPEEKREELLKPFTRGNNSTATAGFGMGLAIVSRISLWHKAKLTIGNSSELGGAEISLVFARCSEQPSKS